MTLKEFKNRLLRAEAIFAICGEGCVRVSCTKSAVYWASLCHDNKGTPKVLFNKYGTAFLSSVEGEEITP